MASWLQDDEPSPGPSAEPTPVRRQGHVEPGMVLNGIYRITRKICETVTSAVFEATNTTSGSKVAIKVILPQLAAIPEMRELLVTEARILENLNHTAIVAYRGVHDDPALGVTYVVTVFVDGPSLLDVMAGFKPSLEEYCGFLLHIASGLAAAHDNKIVHRDVSPDNIMLPNGSQKERRLEQAKLIDFGISKNLIGVESTVIGDGFAGKFGYAAPEQFNGGETGPWTDIYSFGLVLIALAAGKSPGMGRSRSEAIEKRKSVPDVGAVPEVLRPIVEKMLQPDPTQRFRSMREVIARVGERPQAEAPAIEERQEGPKPPPPPKPPTVAPPAPPPTPEPVPRPAYDRTSKAPQWLDILRRNWVGYAVSGAVGVLFAFFILISVNRPTPPIKSASLSPIAQTQGAPTAPVAGPPSERDIERTIATAAANQSCSWLDVADARDELDIGPNTIALIGVGDSAQTIGALTDALRRIGGNVDLDTRNVWSLAPPRSAGFGEASACDVLNVFREHRVPWSAAGRPLWVNPIEAHYLDDPKSAAPCPGGWAKPVAYIDVGDSELHFVLLAINAAGRLALLGDEKWLAGFVTSQLKLVTSDGGGRYSVIFCTDKGTSDPQTRGLQGLVLIEGATMQDIGLQKGKDPLPVQKTWLAKFDDPRNAAWKVQIAWFTVTEARGVP